MGDTAVFDATEIEIENDQLTAVAEDSGFDMQDADEFPGQEPEEILPLAFLETLEEALTLEEFMASEAGISAFDDIGSGERPQVSSRRSGGRSARNSKPMVTGAKAKQAKIILYGGFFLLLLGFVAFASLQLPKFLYSAKYIDTPRIWPWTMILGKWESVVEGKTITRSSFQTADGRTLTQEEHQALVDEATGAYNDINGELRRLQAIYDQALQEDDDAKRIELKNKAFLGISKLTDKVVAIVKKIEPNKGPSLINKRLKSLTKLSEAITPKRFQWSKDADISREVLDRLESEDSSKTEDKPQEEGKEAVNEPEEKSEDNNW